VSRIINCQCNGQEADCIECNGTGRVYSAEEIIEGERIRAQIKVMADDITARFSPAAQRSLDDLPSFTPSKRRDTRWQ